MARLTRYESTDVDDQAQALTGWEQSYEQLGCGRFRGELWQLAMERGVLLREATNRQLREQIAPPEGHVVLAVPLAVEPGSMFAGRALERDSLMVLSGRQEYDVLSAGELDLIGLTVDRELAERTLAPAKIEWLRRAESERNLLLSPEVAAAIRHMFIAVAEGAERELETLASREHESALLSSTLMQTVLLAMQSDRSDTASTIPRRAQTRLQVVRRAIEFMRERIVDDIGIPEICAAACASRRTLQYCFEEFLHTTPQAYLRALRLNEARRALKLGPEVPITHVACEFGFASASHFTRHYKLMFDELPSETVRLQGEAA